MSQNTLKLDYHELVLRHKALTRLQQTFTPSQRHYIISVLVSLFTVAKHLLHRQSLDVYDMGVELSFAYMSSQLQKNAQPKSGFKIAEIVLASMLLVSKTISIVPFEIKDINPLVRNLDPVAFNHHQYTILAETHGQLYRPTPTLFLHILLSLDHDHTKFHSDLSHYIVKLCMVDPHFAQMHNPAIVAACAHYLSLWNLHCSPYWSSTLRKLTKFRVRKDLMPCLHIMWRIVTNANPPESFLKHYNIDAFMSERPFPRRLKITKASTAFTLAP